MSKQDAMLKLRLSRALKAQALAKAKHEGISLSEAIRSMLAAWAKGPPPKKD